MSKCYRATFIIHGEEVNLIFFSTEKELNEVLTKLKRKLDLYNQTNSILVECKEYKGEHFDSYWSRKQIEQL